jgi:hypothetical protein
MSVEWHDRARDQLADIWATSEPAERDVVEAVVHEINARLAAEAQFLGESRRPNERVWFHHPLVVRFHLILGGQIRITHVARLRPWTANE